MAYQVLARKSRPQDFASLIGQEPIVRALHNGLKEGRIAHAYLFSGIRGVGKTSAARILAKAMNCERGPTADPCNECRTCGEITVGGDLDVIEVDAATYSKVEQVRELTESLRYGPARDRYKVVILDEVHRLSRQAFDALLKIVEEPPPHLVFIFATTEIEAVPATILSRCQEFRFRRVSSLVLARHLRAISDQEGLEVSEGSLRLIARAGDGSVRDSVALLDQLATFGGGTIADAEAARLLGGLDTGLFREVLAAILAGDSAGIVSTVHRLEEDGRDPRHVYSQFLSYCRDALHLCLGGDTEHLELPEEDRRELGELLSEISYESLLRLTHLLLGSEAAVRRSDAGLLALEIAWLRAAELPKLTRIEDLLAGRGGGSGAGAAGQGSGSTSRTASPTAPRPVSEARSGAVSRPAARPPESRPDPRDSLEPPRGPGDDDATAPARAAGPSAARSTIGEPPSGPPGPAGGTLEDFLSAVGRRKQPFLVRLRQAEAVDFDGEVLRISGDTVLARVLERSTNRKVLDEAVHEVWGKAGTWSFRESSAAPERPGPEPQDARDGAEDGGGNGEAVLQDPRVQQVLDIFGGTVERVVQHNDPND